jgi:hypothetical protein
MKYLTHKRYGFKVLTMLYRDFINKTDYKEVFELIKDLFMVCENNLY